MKLSAFPKSIEDTLQLTRQYIIPRFQREYSWEIDEISEIMDDLLDNIILDDKGNLQPSEYFIGSLVLVGDDDETTNMERLVVDGQQRLTTFTIMFSVLAQKFKEIGVEGEKLRDKTHEYIIGEDNNGKLYSKLVNEEPKPFFQSRIQKKDIDFSITPKSQAENRMLNAYNYFDKQLKESYLIKEIRKRNPTLEKYNYIDLLKVFRDQILKCKVIYVTVKSVDDAYTIFEVLNSKGKNLESIDIIKNKIFSVLKDEIPLDTASELWKETKKEISKLDNFEFSTFYRHYWLSNYCLSTEAKLVTNFDKFISKNKIEYLSFLKDLKKGAGLYSNIVKINIDDWKQPEYLPIYTSLQAFNIFNITQIRIFLLALFECKDEDLISCKNFKKIIIYLEHYHLVFTAVCSSRPSGLERRYSSYARELRRCKTKDESNKCINNLITDMHESFPDYSTFESNFLLIKYTSDQEKEKKLVQYILRKLERYYAGIELNPNSFSIEHILPESTKTEYVGLVGNLLPLGVDLNSDLQDKDFSTKKTKYSQSQYVTVKNFLTEYKETTKWDESKIFERTKKLAKILYDNIIDG